MSLHPPYVDIHTHRSGEHADVLTVLNLMAGECPETVGTPYYSLGIHPWQLLQYDVVTLKSRMTHDMQRLNPMAIGELGLDRAVAVPIPIQQEILGWQEQLALQYNLPLIHHVVRANDLMLERAKKYPGFVRVIHGFAGKPAEALQYVRGGFMLSLGAALFDTKRQVAESIKSIPAEHLFLETDESSISIQEVYARAASLRNETEEELRIRIFDNFARIFIRK